MDEIDTSKQKGLFTNISGLSKLFGDSTKDQSAEMAKLLAELNKTIDNTDMITDLTETRKGVINIEIRVAKKDGSAYPEPSAKNDTGVTAALKQFAKMMKNVNNNVMLRGSVNENGSINSFYLQNGQKNLVAMFFELPNKPIKVGDSWELSTNLLSVDQNFICDTAYKKNNVTLIALKNTGSETLAVIKYDIIEFISGNFNSPLMSGPEKTMMKMTYNAIAEFSIEKGRWTTYDGVMSLATTGMTESHTTKKFTLIKN